MSDAIEDFKALRQFTKQDRAEAWSRRREIISPILDAGFAVHTVSEECRHLRIYISRSGWFDFWPSTDRWSQSRRPNGARGAHGHGVETLLAALRQAAA